MITFKTRKSSIFAMMLTSSVLISSASFAQQVTLKSDDGRLNIVGKYIDLVDGFYIIDSPVGELRIQAGRVECIGDACPRVQVEAGNVTIVGSEAMGAGLMPFLIQGFANDLDGVVASETQSGAAVASNLVAEGGFGDPIGTFSVSSTTSSDAFSGLREPEVKIGMSSRRILPAEARQLRNFGAGNMIDLNQEHVVAVDSISIIVHPDNPIRTISIENLDLVYAGKITNWADLGGQNAPITVYSRNAESGTAAVFAERVFAQFGDVLSDDAVEQNSNEAMTAAVRQDPNAIGFVATAFERGTKALSLQDTCGLTYSPTAFDAKTEEYPLQRRLYLYNRADNIDPITQAFIDYSLSSAADEMIDKSGLVNLAVSTAPQDLQDSRMRMVLENAIDPFEFQLAREMLLEMFEWDRLSTTFRFASGSARLDGKGLADLARLIEFLRAQPAGTQISIVGFTDSDGAFGKNQQLSLGRAQQVANEVRAAGGADLANLDIEVKGYGELSPSACNESLEGKRINRRVEVWIRS